MNEYDDMMGLEFGEYEGFINTEMIKEALIASTAGGGAILLTSMAMSWASEKLDLAGKIENEYARTALTSGAAFLVAVLGGRALYDYNREAAMGVVGGLGGFAMANLIDGVYAAATKKPRMLGTPLGEDESDEESLLSAYDDDYDGMSALASLETVGVTAAPGAFADPSVTPEALMGLDGTVVQQETLGAYQPYLA